MFRPARVEPGPGQESVWDFPRPPRLEPVADRLTVVVAGMVVADTTAGYRILETSQAPAYYFPPADVDLSCLHESRSQTWCEWKGAASYLDVVVGDRLVHDAAWTYRRPSPTFAPVADHLAFYAQKADRCTVGDEVVLPNDGDFYGGWITSRVVGPFKGATGTRGW
ncbi:MAG: DUF427 domain-containing protein [Actinomycetes bacterium]